jgi:hypothetical protein
MSILWFLLAGLAVAAFWAVAFITICAMIGASRAFRQMPEALKDAFDRPPDAETIARAVALHEIAAGHRQEHLWVYDPETQVYQPIGSARRIQTLAKIFGEIHVLRYDRETEQFSRETVTPDMPLSEILG